MSPRRQAVGGSRRTRVRDRHGHFAPGRCKATGRGMTSAAGRAASPARSAVEAGPDAGAAWHYGDPLPRAAPAGRRAGLVDLSHRGVVRVTGPDRLSWLHSLTTQHLTGLQPGDSTEALVLARTVTSSTTCTSSTTGHDLADGRAGHRAALAQWLDSMRFMLRVEVT